LVLAVEAIVRIENDLPVVCASAMTSCDGGAIVMGYFDFGTTVK